MDERIRIEIDDDGVADVCLQRADKMNAIDAAMFDALVGAQEQLRSAPGLRAVVLRGAGRAFCAGIDMGRVQHMANGQSGRSYLLAERTHGLANKPQQAAWGWRELPVPVIAAVHGVAFGGGLQLALGADIRCVAPDVKLSVMEMKWRRRPYSSARCAINVATVPRSDRASRITSATSSRSVSRDGSAMLMPQSRADDCQDRSREADRSCRDLLTSAARDTIMGAAENKRMMQDIFEELAKGNGRPFVQSLADDFCWTITGTTKWSRTYRGKRAVLDELLGPLFSRFADQYTNTPLRFVAEDDHVVVECRGRVNTKAGLPYNNTYCWICRIADGKLQELTEYLDTELVTLALGDPGARA